MLWKCQEIGSNHILDSHFLPSTVSKCNYLGNACITDKQPFPVSPQNTSHPCPLLFPLNTKVYSHNTSLVIYVLTLPSVLGFFISSTLMSFFLTLRVEFTSLCNLLNFTDSSVSSSDCSLDWQRNKGNINKVVVPPLAPSSQVSPVHLLRRVNAAL